MTESRLNRQTKVLLKCSVLAQNCGWEKEESSEFHNVENASICDYDSAFFFLMNDYDCSWI